MRKILLILSISIFCLQSMGQDVKILNHYKYVNVLPLTYQNGGNDIFGIRQLVINSLLNSGIPIIEDNFSSPDFILNPCLSLFCNISHTNALGVRDYVTIRFVNCENQIVFETKGRCGRFVVTIAQEFSEATKKALKPFKNYNHKFDESKAIQLKYPTVESTTITEEDLKEYYSENELNPIEGIYKSYKSEFMGYYKIGIKRMDGVFKAIILESEHKHWKVGEVKAIFEPATMKGFYSAKWYSGNKTQEQTFALLENGVILSIEFENPKTKEKYNSKFIKMFPLSAGDISYNEVQKSSGSGFFLTSDGVIATNAHVVENAESIKIQISNEIGNFEYNAKVLLKDSKNDVALLKIDDENFKGFSEIPYSLIEKAEIGEKAFTIGYPLNDVMGSNYKVTDGIVSSISGVDDDMRYYQISVPLQPGNSGGPLFNSKGDVIGIASARLNSKAVGTDVENVNYAVKISYLLNLYNMLPNSKKLKTISSQSTKELQDQVKILRNYVCLIKVN